MGFETLDLCLICNVVMGNKDNVCVCFFLHFVMNTHKSKLSNHCNSV